MKKRSIYTSLLGAAVFAALSLSAVLAKGSLSDIRLVINSGGSGMGNLTDTAITSDGRYMITVSDTNIVVIWDIELGKVVRTLTGHTASINAVDLSPDGTVFATSGSDRMLRIWDFQTGTCLATVNTENFIYDIGFSPDGKTIAGTGVGGTFIARASDGEIIKRLAAASFFTAFAPDNGSLYIGHMRYDTARWQLIKKYPGDDENHEYGALSRDGKKLILASKNGNAVMIDAETGNKLWGRSGVRVYRKPFTFFPDGSQVSVVTDKDGIFICDSATGNENRRIGISFPGVVSVTPDGTQVLVSMFNGSINVFTGSSTINRTIVSASYSLIGTVQFRKNDTMLYMSNSNNVISADLASDKKMRFGSHAKFINTCDVNSDGSRAVTGGDGSVKIWDTASGNELFVLSGFFSGHSGTVESAVFSPDGRYIVSCGQDKKVMLWNALTGDAVKKITGMFGGAEQFSSAVFNPSGMRVAVGGKKGTVYVWSIPDGKEVFSIPALEISVESVSWSPDGKYIAAGGYLGDICVIDAGTGAIVKKIKAHESSILALQWTYDGRTLASSAHDNLIKIWDASTWKPVLTIEGHLGRVTSLAFRKDGSYLASASWDGTVRFWHMPGGVPAGIYMEMSGGQSVAVASDGRYDAGDKTIDMLHWVSGMEVVPLQNFGQGFRTDNLLTLLFSQASRAQTDMSSPETKTDVDVSRQLVGKVHSVSRTEVIVAASSSGQLKIRDRLFVLIDGKKVVLEAVMPMHTSVKCRIAGQGKVNKGMPVFK